VKAVCPNCQLPGEVMGGSPEVLPSRLICGNCQMEFPYRATALERLVADAHVTSGAPFFLKPYPDSSRRQKGRGEPLEPLGEAAEKKRIAKLKKVSTQRLLKVFQRARLPGAYDRDGEGYLNGFRYTELELKAELDAREHVPRKR